MIENNFENVGAEFAEEARKIHAGTAVERGIYGTSSADDIQSLTQEGIKVIPLPNHDKNSHWLRINKVSVGLIHCKISLAKS